MSGGLQGGGRASSSARRPGSFREARVLEIMRAEGCDYFEACRRLGARGGRKAAAQRVDGARRAALARASWWWQRDFA